MSLSRLLSPLSLSLSLLKQSTSGCPVVRGQLTADSGQSRIFGTRAVRFDPFCLSRLPVSHRRNSLLCESLAVPAIPRCPARGRTLLQVWQSAEEAFHDGRLWDAAQVLLSAGPRCDDADDTIEDDDIPQFLLQAAQRLLAAGAIASADRCIQKSLNLLATDADRSKDGLDVTRWLVLATNSLLKHDFESCGLWLRQAKRSIQRMAGEIDSTELSHLKGDFLAIEACLKFQHRQLPAAETLLSEAFRYHSDSGSTCSVALDLILRSRCRLALQNVDGAEKDLREASTVNCSALTDELANYPHCLQQVIDDALQTIQTQRQVCAAAEWN